MTPAIPLLGIFPEETKIERGTLFRAVLFTSLPTLAGCFPGKQKLDGGLEAEVGWESGYQLWYLGIPLKQKYTGNESVIPLPLTSSHPGVEKT